MKKADRFKLWYLSAESYAAEQGIHQHYDKFDFGYASKPCLFYLAGFIFFQGNDCYYTIERRRIFVENWILRVDNNLNNFEAAQKVWLKYHVFIKMVRSMPEALKLLTKMDFLLVIIINDGIEYLPYLKLMRDMKPMPILVLSSKYTAFEKLEAIQLGADEYLPYPSTVEEAVAKRKGTDPPIYCPEPSGRAAFNHHYIS